MLLYGLAMLMTLLATELGFLQRILGTTSLSGDQWLICIGFAFALLLVDEVIKVFLRRRSKQGEVPKDRRPDDVSHSPRLPWIQQLTDENIGIQENAHES